MGALINVYPTICEIRGGSFLPWSDIDRACSYFSKGAPFSPAFKEGKWDGVIHLYKRGQFPTGLLNIVLEILANKEIPVEVNYMYEYPAKKYDWKLREDVVFKEEHLNAISAVMSGKRGMTELPTRFGKTTVVTSGCIAGFGVPTLFIAHQLDLIYDAKAIFQKFIDGVGEIGVIGGGELTYKPLTVACIDTLARNLTDYKMQKYLNEIVKFVVVDETQYYGPGEYKDVLTACKAPYRLFMSATVERTDGADIEIQAASGPMLYKLSEQDMIDMRYIADVEVEMVPFDHKLFNKNATGVEYTEFYKLAIVQNQERNRLIVEEIKKLVLGGHPSLIIVKAIEHGEILKAMLETEGVGKVEFIFGDVPPEKRRQLRQSFNAGEFDVLIGSTVFDTAVDLHRASGLVLAASGNSRIRAPQRVGRVLSQVMGKVAIVKDIKDMNVKWFEDDARDRQAVYVSRYGQQRVKVRGADKVTQLERKAKMNYNKMFDTLGI